MRITIKKFQYNNNDVSLITGLISVCIIAVVFYKTDLRYFGATGIKLLFSAMYSIFMLSLIWVAVSSLKTYLRLYGHERFIIIDDTSITFPEYGDSLNIIRLDFSNIRETYFGKDRYGLPGSLIFEYGLDGHAYIKRDLLDKDDFDEICEIIRLRCGLK